MGWKVFHAMMFHGNSAFLSRREVFHDSVFHAAKRVPPLQETLHERVFHAGAFHAVEHPLSSFHAPTFRANRTRPD